MAEPKMNRVYRLYIGTSSESNGVRLDYTLSSVKKVIKGLIKELNETYTQRYLWGDDDEDENHPQPQAYVDGYTIINAQGVWKGTSEKSIILEIIGLDCRSYHHYIIDLKRGLEDKLQQEQVLVSAWNCFIA